ncbi:MAG: hypothetical protein AAGG11_00145 [Pseudomonadota bacterium]
MAAIVLTVLGFGSAVPLAAQPAPADQLLPNRLMPTEAPSRAMTVEEATRLVRKRTGGRVLAAEPTFRRGTPGVSVRVLIEGARVVTLFVDDEGRIRGR